MTVEQENGLASHYKKSLGEYIQGAGEAALQHAYELGRQAMAQGLGALDLARIHQEALVDLIIGVAPPPGEISLINSASLFFTESLAPYEMTHLGFKEALAILSTRTAELEALNKSLGVEIAERVRIETALRRSEERYRSLVDSARDVIYTLSPDGTIVSLNPIFDRITGWKREEWIGKPFIPLLHPDDMVKGMEIFQRLLLGENPSVFELRIMSESGSYLIGEFTTTPLFQGSTVVGILGIARDITARRKAEEDLRKSTAVLQEAEQLAHLGSWDWDIKSGALTWSKELCRIYGVEPEKFGGSFDYFLSLVHPDDRDHVRSTIEESMKSGTPFGFLERIVRPNGEIRILSSRGTVVRAKDGSVLGMRGSCLDVTEAKHAEEALRQLPNRILEAQEIERRRLSHELHDDVCQRLSAMRLNIDVLELDLPGNTVILQKIDGAKNQIDGIITDIRRISWNLRPPMLDDLGLVVALRKLCKDLENVHQLRIRVKASKSIPDRLSAHTEIALYRIAQESLANAIKHAEASTISVGLKSEGNKVMLTVSDDGKGFDASKERHQGPGHGLGLLSMRERTSLLRGTIRISSTPGKGTSVLAELPITFDNGTKEN